MGATRQSCSRTVLDCGVVGVAVSAGSSPRIIRFSTFELNLQTGELRQQGQKLKLQEQSFLVLAALLERPGEVVTREELRSKLWPVDTFVDFDHSLNAAIKRLRDALGESADAPIFIETLARRGYRFIAPVDGSLTPNTAGIVLASKRSPSHPWRRVRPWTLAMASLVIAAAVLLLFLFVSREAGRAVKARPRLVPLTTYTGREYEPALAPDGNRVAFAWSGPDVPLGRTASIYIKQVGEEHALRLTSVPGAIDFGPDWSPDGAYIVFGRFPAPTAAPGTVEAGIYMVPAMGGAERRVHSTNWTLGPIVDSRVAWASNGKTIAFSDRPVGQSHYAVFALDVATLSARQVTFPPELSIGDLHVAFSPDARTLAFLRNTKDGIDVYVIPAAGGSERRLTFDTRDLAGQRSVWLVGLTYTSDGHDIILGGNGLWRIHATGKTKRAEPVPGLGFTAFNPYIRGGRLVYGAPNWDANVYLLPLRNEIAAGEPAKLIASTFLDEDAQLSPDSRNVVFSSDRTGAAEIWKANSDGSNPLQLTFLYGYSGTPRWSASGREIVFSTALQGNADLFIISADGGPPRQITTDSSNDVAPNYSRDGRWIYFASDRGGSWNVWKMPADGRPATQVTRNGGFFASESPDGQYL